MRTRKQEIFLKAKFETYLVSFPGGSNGKESACMVGVGGSIPGSGRFPGEGNSTSLEYFLPGEFHGQRSLVGYSPWDHKESDTSEWTSTFTFFRPTSKQISSNFRFYIYIFLQQRKKELWSIFNFDKKFTENIGCWNSHELKSDGERLWKCHTGPSVPLLIWWSEVERTKDSKGN